MGKQFGELELIARIRSGWGGQTRGRRGVTLGIGDDCALLRPPRGEEVALTTDLSLEGRHFRRDWHPPESVGHRTLARGLSDLAAMGARPAAAFLSLALPRELVADRAGRQWVERFFTGIRSLAERHGIALEGGDTAESPAGLVLADIVLTGFVPAGRALLRRNARPGDSLYVTGSLGGAAAQLNALAAGWRPGRIRSQADHPQLFPEPRVDIGLALVRRKLAHAAIDLSDGLSTDLTHLCEESGVAAEIDEAALPIHPLARAAGHDALGLALHGGEDYELLFTSPPAARMPKTLAGVPVTLIGRITRGSDITLVAPDETRSPLPPAGWQHLSDLPHPLPPL